MREQVTAVSPLRTGRYLRAIKRVRDQALIALATTPALRPLGRADGLPGLWHRGDGTEVNLVVPERLAGSAAKN